MSIQFVKSSSKSTNITMKHPLTTKIKFPNKETKSKKINHLFSYTKSPSKIVYSPLRSKTRDILYDRYIASRSTSSFCSRDHFPQPLNHSSENLNKSHKNQQKNKNLLNKYQNKPKFNDKIGIKSLRRQRNQQMTRNTMKSRRRMSEPPLRPLKKHWNSYFKGRRRSLDCINELKRKTKNIRPEIKRDGKDRKFCNCGEKKDKNKPIRKEKGSVDNVFEDSDEKIGGEHGDKSGKTISKKSKLKNESVTDSDEFWLSSSDVSDKNRGNSSEELGLDLRRTRRTNSADDDMQSEKTRGAVMRYGDDKYRNIGCESATGSEDETKLMKSPLKHSAKLCKPTRLLSFSTPKKNIKETQRRRTLTSTSLARLPGFEEHERAEISRKLFAAKKPKRAPRMTAFRTLDAPGLSDNYYLSLLDWSSSNSVAVSLSRAVYIYGVASHGVAPLFEQQTGDPRVSSLAWDPRGARLAVGFASGRLELWDSAEGRLDRRLRPHTARIGTSGWMESLLATGSRDRTVNLLDVRTRSEGPRLRDHKQEVCGLRWAPFEPKTLATGGNDNSVVVWDLATGAPTSRYCEHKAAVKAIDWSPHKPGLLASGGGRTDNTIRFWDCKSSDDSSILSIDAKSQICNLRWSRNSDEIVTTHGYPKNQLKIFEYGKEIKCVAKLDGHSGRVLHLAMSPDGTSIVTGSGDETLKFWRLFPAAKKSERRMFPRSRLLLPTLR